MTRPPTPIETEAGVRFELRRRLAVVYASAEFLFEDLEGELTHEQREAVEAIISASSELSALVAHGPEPTDPTLTADEYASATTSTPAVSDSTPFAIVLAIEPGPFATALTEQFERSGYDVDIVSDIYAIDSSDDDSGAADTARYVVLDVGILPDPPTESLNTVSERVKDPSSLILVSTIDDRTLPTPFMGISGFLSPRATRETVATVFETQHVDLADSPRVVVATAPGEDPGDGALLERLESLGCIVETASVTGIDEYAALHDIDCVFLSEAGLAVLDESDLVALRTPASGPPLPVVAVGRTAMDTEWVPVCGYQQFTRRSLSAVELAGEIRLAIDPEGP
ncbi:hypothetical protein D8Y22_12515 [Salinadaptatus halalkaliphilus]|uniref:Uncharacterized protein n=1 Tax=Salinadaptatus halalkaliphilus TaxID=2419781 RepID=A0A4S3TK39_9EURY|nr:hypothetical protein [Salinadaptatus halalkaliphilus]THE64462.1 hypothetical protein D8Y22_12515 [Salinadaptatus halalkaliphilus]